MSKPKAKNLPAQTNWWNPRGWTWFGFNALFQLICFICRGNRTCLISPYSGRKHPILETGHLVLLDDQVFVRWSLFNEFVLEVFPLPFAIHLKNTVSFSYGAAYWPNPPQKETHLPTNMQVPIFWRTVSRTQRIHGTGTSGPFAYVNGWFLC